MCSDQGYVGVSNCASDAWQSQCSLWDRAHFLTFGRHRYSASKSYISRAGQLGSFSIGFKIFLRRNIGVVQVWHFPFSAPFSICYHNQLRASSDNSMPRLRSSCTSKINTELLNIRSEFNGWLSTLAHVWFFYGIFAPCPAAFSSALSSLLLPTLTISAHSFCIIISPVHLSVGLGHYVLSIIDLPRVTNYSPCAGIMHLATLTDWSGMCS